MKHDDESRARYKLKQYPFRKGRLNNLPIYAKKTKAQIMDDDTFDLYGLDSALEEIT